ncbi:MAG: hypothetical protein GY950_03935 [bacterium]|nr:hypothetical protein [bacterium]
MRHKIDVTCYAGYRGNERPKKFIHQNKEFQIKKILQRSVEETINDHGRVYRFQVTCTDDKTYSILYDSIRDEWFIILPL